MAQDAPTKQEFLAAVTNGDLSLVANHIELGADVDGKDGYNNTALMIAVQKGHVGVAQILIDAGAKLDEKNSYNNTALLLAVDNGQIKTALALIDAGAELDGKNGGSNTALLLAVKKSHSKIAKALIEAGAELDEKDGDKKTALMKAIESTQEEIALFLIDSGAGLDEKDNGGMTALMLAAYKGANKVANSLIENGAELEEKDSQQRTASYYAEQWGRTSTLAKIKTAAQERDEKGEEERPARKRPQRKQRDPEETLSITARHMEILKHKKAPKALRLSGKESDKKEEHPVDGAEPVETAAEASCFQEVWALMGKDSVAYINFNPDLRRKLTHIFNFASRERLTITQNMDTGLESSPPEKNFDDLLPEYLEKALQEFNRLGGVADADFVIRGITKMNKGKTLPSSHPSAGSN